MGVIEDTLPESKRLRNMIAENILRISKELKSGNNELFKTTVKLNGKEFEVGCILNIDIDPGIDGTVMYRYSMGTKGDFEIRKNKLKIKQLTEELNILSLHIATSAINIEDVIKCVEGKLEISKLSHELKHLYDNYYSDKDAGSFSDYESFQKGYPVKSASEFMHMLYYMSIDENLVRANEFYSEMMEKGITKSDFATYIQESELMKYVRKSEHYSIEKLEFELEQDPGLVGFIEGLISGGYTSVGSPVDDMLNIMFINITNDKLGSLHNYMGDYVKSISFAGKNPFDIMFGNVNPVPDGDVDKLNRQMSKNVSKLKRFYKNPRKFFEIKIKKLNFTSKKLKKKLSKLYDMLPESKNEKNSIVDWETFNKVNSSEIKISIDFSKFKK